MILSLLLHFPRGHCWCLHQCGCRAKSTRCAISSIDSEIGLLVFVLAGKLIHNSVFTELSPHEIDFLDFFFVVQEPPVSGLEQGSNQDRVVALTYEALILLLGLSYLLLTSVHILSLSRLVLFLHNFAKIPYQFFFNQIGLFPTSFDASIALKP